MEFDIDAMIEESDSDPDCEIEEFIVSQFMK